MRGNILGDTQTSSVTNKKQRPCCHTLPLEFLLQAFELLLFQFEWIYGKTDCQGEGKVVPVLQPDTMPRRRTDGVEV